jgi:hypothetical protein
MSVGIIFEFHTILDGIGMTSMLMNFSGENDRKKEIWFDSVREWRIEGHRREEGEICKKVIDGSEFCVRADNAQKIV